MQKIILLILASVALAQQKYDFKTGLEYYYYSNVVFCDDKVIEDWSCRYPCTNTTGMINTKVIYNAKTNIRAYIGYQSKTNQIVTSFRGSEDWKNWLIDGSFYAQEYDRCQDCKLHSGFYFAFKGVEETLVKNTLELLALHPGASLSYTGHSLGGALATVAAVEFKLLGYNVQGLYTYGSPRVGNPEYARFSSTLIPITFRHVYHNDIVPHLPPQWTGYQHVTQEIWQEKDGIVFHLCDSSDGEDSKCSASIPAFKYSSDEHTHYFNRSNGCDGGFPSIEITQ